MKDVLKGLFGVLLIASRVVVGIYFLWYLIGNLHSPLNYPLEKMLWFVYFFIWDMWISMSNQKISEISSEQNEG